jgi:hypothetical protein
MVFGSLGARKARLEAPFRSVLASLITQRSQVQILSPQPNEIKHLRPPKGGRNRFQPGEHPRSLEAKEHVGGFTILEAADMDEALEWARRSVIACRMPIEVREIPYSNLPNGTAHPSRQHRQKP